MQQQQQQQIQEPLPFAELVESRDVLAEQQAEDRADAQQLSVDAVAIRGIMADMGKMVLLQGEALVQAREHTDDAEQNVHVATEQITKAGDRALRGRVWKVTLLGLGVGAMLGFPLGAGIAAAASASTALVGAGVTGTVVGSVVGGSTAYAAAKSQQPA